MSFEWKSWEVKKRIHDSFIILDQLSQKAVETKSTFDASDVYGTFSTFDASDVSGTFSTFGTFNTSDVSGTLSTSSSINDNNNNQLQSLKVCFEIIFCNYSGKF